MKNNRCFSTCLVLLVVLAMVMGCSNTTTKEANNLEDNNVNAVVKDPVQDKEDVKKDEKPFEGETISFVTANHPWGDA